MPNTIRIKRRDKSNADDISPSSLAQGELAFNEHSRVLHYGRGSTPAVVAIAGDGHNVILPSNGTTLGFVAIASIRSGETMHTTSALTLTGTANQIDVANGTGLLLIRF